MLGCCETRIWAYADISQNEDILVIHVHSGFEHVNGIEYHVAAEDRVTNKFKP